MLVKALCILTATHPFSQKDSGQITQHASSAAGTANATGYRSPDLAVPWCRRGPGAKSPWIFRQRGNSPAAPIHLHMRPAKSHHVKSTPETIHKGGQVRTIAATARAL